MTQTIRKTANKHVLDLVRSLWDQQDWDGAVRELADRAGRGHPDFSWFLGLAYIERGYATAGLRDAVDDYRRALQALETAATLDPALFPRDNTPSCYWPDRGWAIPAYVQLFRHQYAALPPHMRRQTARFAAQSLGRMGRVAAFALPALREAEAAFDPLANFSHAEPNPFTRAIEQIKQARETERDDPVTDEACRRLGEHHYISPNGTETDYTEGLVDDLDQSAASLLVRLTDPDAGTRARAACLLGLRMYATGDVWQGQRA